MLRDAWRIALKDLRIEQRTREALFTVVLFGLLAVVVFALSFTIERDTSRAYGPGVIWVTVLFAGTLGLQRLFAPEQENDCLGGLLLSPASARGLYLGKLAVQILFMAVMEIVTIPTAFLFFDLFEYTDAAGLGLVAALLVLGTVGFAIVGTLFAAMLLHNRLRDVMLPIIVYPLVTPVLIAGVQATRSLFMGEPHQAALGWMALVGAFDLIYLAVSLAIFPYMARE